MDYSFFAMIFRQRYIKRWSLMKNQSEETLSEHAMQCAVLAHALAVINRDIFGGDADPDKAAAYALFHDSAEVLCGDLPTPVKYASAEMRDTYRKIEDSAAATLLSKLPPELQSVYRPLVSGDTDPETARLVKTADRLSALIKCIEEEKSGNSEFRAARASTLALLSEMPGREIHYFMEHFLPAYEKTLDEI